MQAKNDISDELRSLSALVAGIGRQSPYKLPEGYFEGLPRLILGRIARLATPDGPAAEFPADGLSAGAPSVIEESLLASNLPKSLTFSVPEGYFDDFASRVLGRIKAGTSGASNGSVSNDFMTESVQEELARLSAVVSGITRENPYRLPEGYFAEVSPVLSLLKDKTTYLAPEGYFDYLPAAVTGKVIHEEAGAKVIAIGSRGKLVKGHWWKYAGAAAAACLILVFSWPQLHTSLTKTDEGQHVAQIQLAQGLSSRLSQGLNKVSDQDIQNYLDDESSIQTEPVTSSTATLDMNDSDVKTLLGDVPDNELQQYMEEHGRANDIATN